MRPSVWTTPPSVSLSLGAPSVSCWECLATGLRHSTTNCFASQKSHKSKSNLFVRKVFFCSRSSGAVKREPTKSLCNRLLEEDHVSNFPGLHTLSRIVRTMTNERWGLHIKIHTNTLFTSNLVMSETWPPTCKSKRRRDDFSSVAGTILARCLCLRTQGR